MTATAIKNWLMTQEGYTYRPDRDSIRVTEDPQVRDTWAVRFNDLADERVVDLLFILGSEEGSISEVLDRCLEEVEYTSWPPVSGNLSFFS